MNSHLKPIVVDLDGTLINTDLLFESFFKLIKKNPLYIIKTFFWLFQGKSFLKYKIATEVDIDVSLLPYNFKLLEYLKDQKNNRKLILASASNIKYVHQVANFLDIFDAYIGSDMHINLSGEKKRKSIEELIGNNSYIYAGNSMDDLPIWIDCKDAITVNLPSRVSKRLIKNSVLISSKFNSNKTSFMTWIKCLRVHQWTKNLLMFVPLLFSQQFTSPIMVSNSFLAFIVFSICASSVYLLNDLLDIEEDRQHKSKKYRPIASGEVSLISSFLLVPILFLISFYLSLNFLPIEFNIFYNLLLYNIAIFFLFEKKDFGGCAGACMFIYIKNSCRNSSN